MKQKRKVCMVMPFKSKKKEVVEEVVASAEEVIQKEKKSKAAGKKVEIKEKSILTKDGLFSDSETSAMMESYAMLPYNTMFPQKVSHSDFGDLFRMNISREGYKKVTELVEAGEVSVFIATYFPKRRMKLFDYDTSFAVTSPKKGFEHDLDLSTVVITCETIDRLYAMSAYTEAMYVFEAEDFEPVEFDNPIFNITDTIYCNGKGGMLFAVYTGLYLLELSHTP